ncbi:Uncharacterized protein TCM_026000 [Theobroma cacao]|uniref:Uncharacterized protein n=1 Tax=Theobroma cacao TaxID=3641 RepID=A0A061F224_THECC|nr:Uncharacterized protein TCM_026000 [Theobroma cacao]
MDFIYFCPFDILLGSWKVLVGFYNYQMLKDIIAEKSFLLDEDEMHAF